MADSFTALRTPTRSEFSSLSAFFIASSSLKNNLQNNGLPVTPDGEQPVQVLKNSNLCMMPVLMSTCVWLEAKPVSLSANCGGAAVADASAITRKTLACTALLTEDSVTFCFGALIHTQHRRDDKRNTLAARSRDFSPTKILIPRAKKTRCPARGGGPPRVWAPPGAHVCLLGTEYRRLFFLIY